MNRFLLLIAGGLTLVASLGAETLSPQVQPTVDVGAGDALDRLNAFGARQTLVTEYYNTLEMAAEKVNFSFGLGYEATVVYQQAWAPLGTDHLTNPGLDFTPVMLFQWNLHPPFLYRSRLESKLRYLAEYSSQFGLSLGDDARTVLRNIQGSLDAEVGRPAWERLSFGLGVPVLATTTSQFTTQFYSGDIFAFVGTDLMDSLSAEIGTNLFLNRVFVGLSVDVSTPVYRAGDNIVTFLRQTFAPTIGSGTVGVLK